VATPWGGGKSRDARRRDVQRLEPARTLGVLLASDVLLADALGAMATLVPPPGACSVWAGGVRRSS